MGFILRLDGSIHLLLQVYKAERDYVLFGGSQSVLFYVAYRGDRTATKRAGWGGGEPGGSFRSSWEN